MGDNGRLNPLRRLDIAMYQRYWYLKNMYDLSPSDYEDMYLWQAGRCGLCFQETGEWLSVDHDHRSGQVRGLLCRKCNSALERVDEISGWLDRARGWVQ